ncbi:MAG: MarR family transcriptional regulator [Coriobacteriia bacterium]|nr:MarR family transcriptional regulator [Coriobacteriia bacterium]
MAETSLRSKQASQVSSADISSRELAAKMFETMPSLGRMMRRERLNGTGDFQQVHALKHLMSGPLPQAKLAESLRMNPSALSKLIDVLEQKGYVTRMIDPEDRRRMVIALTDEGRIFQRKMLAQAMEQANRTLKTLSPEERTTLSEALDIVTKLIETDHREGR